MRNMQEAASGSYCLSVHSLQLYIYNAHFSGIPDVTLYRSLSSYIFKNTCIMVIAGTWACYVWRRDFDI